MTEYNLSKLIEDIEDTNFGYIYINDHRCIINKETKYLNISYLINDVEEYIKWKEQAKDLISILDQSIKNQYSNIKEISGTYVHPILFNDALMWFLPDYKLKANQKLIKWNFNKDNYDNVIEELINKVEMLQTNINTNHRKICTIISKVNKQINHLFHINKTTIKQLILTYIFFKIINLPINYYLNN